MFARILAETSRHDSRAKACRRNRDFAQRAKKSGRIGGAAMRYRFGEHTLDTQIYELLRAGEPVATEPQVFSLLRFLVENPDRVVTKDELIESVWNGRIVSDATLSSRINAARQAVGDNGAEYRDCH